MSLSAPIIPWLGGKRRLAKTLIPMFPEHVCYVEPFAGAAALFFLKEPSKAEVLNDVNGDLVNLYRVVKCHLEEFLRQFKWALTSRQIFKWQQETRPETLTDIQRAARFFYLQKLAFGGRVAGQSYGVSTSGPARINLMRIEEDLSAAHLRLSTAQIEHLHWADCIERYDRPHSFFYVDPPYWQTEGYGVSFPWAEYERLASLYPKLKGQMLISLNDHPDIRKLFAGIPMVTADINYTVGGAQKAQPAKELIIGHRTKASTGP